LIDLPFTHIHSDIVHCCVSSKKYKYVKRDRILPKVSEPSVPSAAAGSASALQTSATAASVIASGGGAGAVRPLGGLQFVVIGKLSRKKADIGKLVAELGGRLATTVDDKVAACVSTQGPPHFISLIFHCSLLLGLLASV